MKHFHVQEHIGRAKYIVSYHDGHKTYDDGSIFFDVSIFKNKKKLTGFIDGLRRDGYVEKTYYTYLPTEEEKQMDDPKYKSGIEQRSDAWNSVWFLCEKLGMKQEWDKTGEQRVLDFIQGLYDKSLPDDYAEKLRMEEELRNGG